MPFDIMRAMKTLTRKCSDCGLVNKFLGEDAKQIMAAMDALEWQMMPGDDSDLCAKCFENHPEPCCDPE